MSKLGLPNVTLLFVEGRKYSLAQRALEHCVNLVDFGAAKILTPELPSVLHHSYYMFTEAYKHVDTEFFLAAQWDGVVWDTAQWDDEYLEYDYIGAPWPDEYLGSATKGMNVGNGGFSLRSRRLYEFIANDPEFDRWTYEDVEVCRNQRYRLESHGFKFAPIELAQKFSFESDGPRPATSFGVHGSYAMQTVMPDFFNLQKQDMNV
jgi:Protein of unknown function (DUF5672)